jgi:hypothetical protein
MLAAARPDEPEARAAVDSNIFHPECIIPNG